MDPRSFDEGCSALVRMCPFCSECSQVVWGGDDNREAMFAMVSGYTADPESKVENAGNVINLTKWSIELPQARVKYRYKLRFQVIINVTTLTI